MTHVQELLAQPEPCVPLSEKHDAQDPASRLALRGIREATGAPDFFYSRLAYRSEMPVVEHPSPDTCVVARIVADNVLEINNTPIVLDDYGLFVTNALLSHRDSPWVSQNELRALDSAHRKQHPLAEDVLAQRTAEVIDAINESARQPVIKTRHSTQHKLTPELIVADMRKGPRMKAGTSVHAQEVDSDANERHSLAKKLVRKYSDQTTTERFLVQKLSGNGELLHTDDSVRAYLSNIGQYELLTPEEETRYFAIFNKGMDVLARLEGRETTDEKLITILQNAAAARQVLLTTNLRLVVSVAKKLYKEGDSLKLLDLIQEGNAGLAKAISMFEPEKGYKLSTYAINWIKNYVITVKHKQEREIRIPTKKSERLGVIRKHSAELAVELQREPSPEELAKKVGLEVHKLTTLLSEVPSLISYHKSIDENNDGELLDLLAETKVSATQDEEHVLSRQLLQQALVTCCTINRNSSSATRNIFVLGLCYGISPDTIGNISYGGIAYEDAYSGAPMSAERVAAIIGVSRSTISGRRKKAEALLKTTMQSLDITSEDIVFA